MTIDSRTWGVYFSGPYAVAVNGVMAHTAQLTFTPNSAGGYGSDQWCLAVTLTPEGGVHGSSAGFFHIVPGRQCSNHRGDYQGTQGTEQLTGGWMECKYVGSGNDSGYTRATLLEIPHPEDPAHAYLKFTGWVRELVPQVKDDVLEIIALTKRSRIGKYPWLP